MPHKTIRELTVRDEGMQTYSKRKGIHNIKQDSCINYLKCGCKNAFKESGKADRVTESCTGLHNGFEILWGTKERHLASMSCKNGSIGTFIFFILQDKEWTTLEVLATLYWLLQLNSVKIPSLLIALAGGNYDRNDDECTHGCRHVRQKLNLEQISY